VAKFRALADGVLEPAEQDRLLDLAARLPALSAAELARLTVTAAGLPEGDPGLF
jgi:2-methylcitrate dehydratase